MKLSEYGTLVSTQMYFVNPDNSIAAMTYKNDISDVDLTMEKVNGSIFHYTGEMKHHGRKRHINCNLIPENLSKALEIRNHSTPDKALSLTMRQAPKDNIINGKYKASLPLELPDHNKILYTFEVDEENMCMLFENNTARVLSVKSDGDLKLEYEIIIFGNTAFTYNVSSKPFSIDAYTILSKDGNMINTSYTGMLAIPNCPDKNLFYPQAVIYFENGIHKTTIELTYDNLGILMDGSDHRTRYERTDYYSISCHPVYLDSFNPEMYFDNGETYWVMEQSYVNEDNSFDATKQVYKIDPRKKKDLLDFIENAEPKLMLELDMDDDKEE
jgi:hypothetical protein